MKHYERQGNSQTIFSHTFNRKARAEERGFWLNIDRI
jgi:hypothetical protein